MRPRIIYGIDGSEIAERKSVAVVGNASSPCRSAVDRVAAADVRDDETGGGVMLTFNYPIKVDEPNILRVYGALTDQCSGPYYRISVSVVPTDWSGGGERPVGQEFRYSVHVPAMHGVQAVMYAIRAMIEKVERGFLEKHQDKHERAEIT